MNVERFKQVFDTLDEEGQKNVISHLTDEELTAVQNYKPTDAVTKKYPSSISEMYKQLGSPKNDTFPYLANQEQRKAIEQHAGAASEAALSPPALMGGLGLAAGGPVGGLIGLGIGTLGEVPAMITGDERWSPTGLITSKLRQYGITPQPDPEYRFGRKVAGYIGSGIPTMGFGATPARAMRDATIAGLGAATATEAFGDNPLVEMAGAMTPSTLGSGLRAGWNAVRPTGVLARKAEVRTALEQPGARDKIAEGRALQSEFGGQLSAAETGLGEGTRSAQGEVAGYFPVTEAARKTGNFNSLLGKLKSVVNFGAADDAAAQLSGKSISKLSSLKSNRVPEMDEALRKASEIEAGQSTINVDSVKKGIIEEIRKIRKAKPVGEASEDTINYLRAQYKKLPGGTKVIDAKIDLQNIDTTKPSRTIIQKPNAINVEGAQSLLHDYTVAARSTSGMLKDTEKAALKYGGRFMKNLLSEAVENASKNGNESASILIGARSKYADVMADLAEVGATPLGKIIERSTKKGGILTTRDVQAAWKRSSPEEREVITRLIGTDKQMMESLVASKFDEMLEKATIAEPEIGRSTIDPKRLLDEWKIDKNFRDMLSGNPELLGKLTRAREYLNRIINRGPEKAAQGPVGAAASAGQQAVGMATHPTGQSNIFLGGNIAKHLFPRIYRKILTTDEGIDALMKVSQPGKYKVSEVAAANALINSVTEEN